MVTTMTSFLSNISNCVRCCLRKSVVANRLMDLVGYSGDSGHVELQMMNNKSIWFHACNFSALEKRFGERRSSKCFENKHYSES
jgi:hypothetical protein